MVDNGSAMSLFASKELGHWFGYAHNAADRDIASPDEEVGNGSIKIRSRIELAIRYEARAAGFR
jgi:hypothetical protein